MRVLAFASQKGGSGKTTLAGHIAVQAELAGAGPVAIIDTDPQGSLSEWWNGRGLAAAKLETENDSCARPRSGRAGRSKSSTVTRQLPRRFERIAARPFPAIRRIDFRRGT